MEILKIDKGSIDALKLCLEGGKCTECAFGNSGTPMLTCRELIQNLAEFFDLEKLTYESRSSISIKERSNNDDNLHV